jgi:DNA-binding beta-propeller fold protein YncE
MRTRSTLAMGIFVMLAGCSSGSNGTGPIGTPDASPGDGSSALPDASMGEAGKPKVSTTPSHGSTIALTGDDSRLVVANHDVGTATVFSVDYAAATQPTLNKLAEIAVGSEPSAVAVHPDGDTAFVLSRKDQKLVKITGLLTTPVKAAEVAVGSEPTGMAMTPLGSMVWVANWVDGTLMGIHSDTMTVATTIDLNAALAAAPYLGAGVTSRPAIAHPRALAITNNGDTVEDDETIYVAEFFAQQKVPLASDGSNADVAKVGIVYKIPLATKAVSLIELPPMTDMGFQDHTGGMAGCFPNQLHTINIQGGFGYIMSTCASPKAPIGLFTGPAAASCKADATCPGAATGSCGGLLKGTCKTMMTTACVVDADCPGAAVGGCMGGVAGICKTTCAADAVCGANGGKCVPTAGTDPTVGGVCAGNPADIQTTTAPVVSIIDLGGSKTIATVNFAKEFSKYFDQLGMPDDATRRIPLLPADVGFVPGTVTAYVPAYGADAVFRVDFDATYASAAIDSVGDPKNPFMSLFSAAIDPSHNGQLPSGIAVAHATHTMGSTVRYAFTANDHTRNVTVLDLAAQEIAGLTAGTPTTAAASAPATDATEIAQLEGKRKFITGLGRWSWKGQAWQGCSNCHSDGLTDNVTWYLGRGPRQSPNLDASFVKAAWAKNDATDYRINSWQGTQDEIADHEGAIRSLSGGVGAIVKDTALAFTSRLDVPNQTGLNGSSLAVADPANPGHFPSASVLTDWQQIVAWARIVRSPHKPSNLDPAKVTAGQALFTGANCQGCHGGPLWTISQVFYAPDPTGVTNNKLKTLSWSTAVHQSGFPTALLPVLDTLPTPPMGLTYSGQTMRYSGNKPALYDEMTCALRPVGTYGVAQAEAGIGELRGDMITPAQGFEPDCAGFNVPPLLNAVTGAPYFHAGNALSLEAMFSPTFQAHYQALAPGFLADTDSARADHVASLIQFILSIDGDTTPMAIPPLGPTGGSFCVAQ